jgi:hypothetical protein
MNYTTGSIKRSSGVTGLCSRPLCRDISCINSNGLIHSINLFTCTSELAGQSSTEYRPLPQPADHGHSTHRDITSSRPIISSPTDQGSGTRGKNTDGWGQSHLVTYITTQNIEFSATTSDTKPSVRDSTRSESHSLSPRVAALIFGTITGAIVYVIVVSTIVRLFRVNPRPLSVTYNPNVSYFSSDSD